MTRPARDDFAFTLDWEDGIPATATTYYIDGVGPDPFPSHGGTFPFAATDSRQHIYSMAGTYTVTIRVSDDDGSTAGIVVVLVFL